jgi:hypothetical protein
MSEGIRRGIIGGRLGEIKGSGATVELGVMSNPEGILKSIDPKGAENPSDLDSKTIAESVESGDSREMVFAYLKIIFKEFLGKQIYPIKNIDELVAAHRGNLEPGPKDLFYFIDEKDSKDIEDRLDGSVSLSATDPGLTFSKVTGGAKDVLRGNSDTEKIGFTRKMEMDGEIFTIKFLYRENSAADDEQEEYSLAA